MTRVSVYVLCNGEGPFSGWCIIIGSGGEEVFDFGDKLAGTKLRDMERRLRALTEEAGEARCEFRVEVAIVGVVAAENSRLEESVKSPSSGVANSASVINALSLLFTGTMV